MGLDRRPAARPRTYCRKLVPSHFCGGHIRARNSAFSGLQGAIDLGLGVSPERVLDGRDGEPNCLARQRMPPEFLTRMSFRKQTLLSVLACVVCARYLGGHSRTLTSGSGSSGRQLRSFWRLGMNTFCAPPQWPVKRPLWHGMIRGPGRAPFSFSWPFEVRCIVGFATGCEAASEFVTAKGQ